MSTRQDIPCARVLQHELLILPVHIGFYDMYQEVMLQ